MKEIFEKISNVGFELTEKLIRGKFKEKNNQKVILRFKKEENLKTV